MHSFYWSALDQLSITSFKFKFKFSLFLPLFSGQLIHPKSDENKDIIYLSMDLLYKKSLNIVIKHVFICSNPYIYSTVVQEMYNRDRSPEVDDIEGLAAAATKHRDLLKQKDEAEFCYNFVI
jgi:hypothetical protein